MSPVHARILSAVQRVPAGSYTVRSLARELGGPDADDAALRGLRVEIRACPQLEIRYRGEDGKGRLRVFAVAS